MDKDMSAATVSDKDKAPQDSKGKIYTRFARRNLTDTSADMPTAILVYGRELLQGQSYAEAGRRRGEYELVLGDPE